MAERIVQEESLLTVADAIREKTGGTEGLSFPEGFVQAINGISGSSGGGSGGAFQVGTVVSADGANLVVPCTLDNILIVRKHPPDSANTAYLLNATGLVANGLKIEVATVNSAYLANKGIGIFSITKENGQTTFTQTNSIKFTDVYCYIAWNNAE